MAAHHTCNGCNNTWTGTNRAHCHACHHTFNSPTLFDRHRRNSTCHTPETLGLTRTPDGIYRDHTRTHPNATSHTGHEPQDTHP